MIVRFSCSDLSVFLCPFTFRCNLNQMPYLSPPGALCVELAMCKHDLSSKGKSSFLKQCTQTKYPQAMHLRIKLSKNGPLSKLPNSLSKSIQVSSICTLRILLHASAFLYIMYSCHVSAVEPIGEKRCQPWKSISRQEVKRQFSARLISWFPLCPQSSIILACGQCHEQAYCHKRNPCKKTCLLDLQGLAQVESAGKLTCAAAIFACTFSRLASKVILWLRGCSVPSDALKEILKLSQHEGEWPKRIFKDMSVVLTLDDRSRGAALRSPSLRLLKYPTNTRVSNNTLPTYLDSPCHPPHHALKTYYLHCLANILPNHILTWKDRIGQADVICLSPSISSVCPISCRCHACLPLTHWLPCFEKANVATAFMVSPSLS